MWVPSSTNYAAHDILAAMFSLPRPSASSIRRMLERAAKLPLSYNIPLNTQIGPGLRVPDNYVLDHTRTLIGHGPDAFVKAKAAMQSWQHFDLGWVQVANPDVAIAQNEIVAVEAHALGLWSVNLSRILYTIDESHRFGYGYGTTPLHVERGEERFLIEHDPATGTVHYDLLAISQPAHLLARLAYPYTRSRQRKFALQSHQHMRQAASRLAGNADPLAIAPR